ncbi:hypothetical protein [Acinetobacter sp. FDAARGOS_515]|uniref:hypothetical protein n=1 Tax=Acinetobacter sp. FDAARGOS_515 TaxID=2420307 RepID=UPI000F672AD9|nr:hypothetical protein [Acinetobacter sp. FDAARGOS_515]RSC23517.1 hypothetical protein EGS47_12570 [Acinetobacter sp. FDAARGOS_515]
MIDLEKEYKAFENTWILLGASFKNFKRGSNNMYHFCGDITDLTDTEKTLTLSCINTALAMWLLQARAKQAKIEKLKEKLAKVESDEFVVVPKSEIENWYLDESECVWYEKDSIDGYLEDLNNGEVLEVQRKEYVVINSNPVFATNVFTDSDNIQWELFDSKEDAEKAAAHCKAMVEAQGDGDE